MVIVDIRPAVVHSSLPQGLYHLDATDGHGRVSMVLVVDGTAWPTDAPRLRRAVADDLERQPGLFVRQLEYHGPRTLPTSGD